jgi:hypothetical protein
VAARVGLAALFAFAATVAPGAARGDDFPTEITGQAALAHPAGKAVVEAARLLRAGKLAEVKQKSVKEVRDEWTALSAAERKEESERARERAPDPATFEADIARVGILLLYGETATLRVPTEDGADVTAMAFLSLEAGKWKVTGGPMAFEPAPAETAPPVEGAAILEHEIGRLAVEYAKRLEAGKIDAAIELLSGPARAKRAAEPATERQESDAYRRRTTPPAAAFAEQIRGGGDLRFFGAKAALNVVTNVKTDNPDGSTSYTSTTTALPFELERGAWRIAD